MTEFEKENLKQQRLSFDMQQLAMKEQREYQQKVENDKKAAELIKAKTSFEKVMESCSQSKLAMIMMTWTTTDTCRKIFGPIRVFSQESLFNYAFVKPL